MHRLVECFWFYIAYLPSSFTIVTVVSETFPAITLMGNRDISIVNISSCSKISSLVIGMESEALGFPILNVTLKYPEL